MVVVRRWGLACLFAFPFPFALSCVLDTYENIPTQTIFLHRKFPLDFSQRTCYNPTMPQRNRPLKLTSSQINFLSELKKDFRTCEQRFRDEYFCQPLKEVQ